VVVADQTTRPAGLKTGGFYSTGLGGVKERQADAGTNTTDQNPQCLPRVLPRGPARRRGPLL